MPEYSLKSALEAIQEAGEGGRPEECYLLAKTALAFLSTHQQQGRGVELSKALYLAINKSGFQDFAVIQAADALANWVAGCSLSRAPQPDTGWQPIETAARDSRAILLWCPERQNIYCGCWGTIFLEPGEHECWVLFGGPTTPIRGTPTHWMPLPKPPEPK